DEFVQSIAADYPLGIHADIFVENALQSSFADAGLANQVVHGLDVAVFENTSNQPARPHDGFIRRRGQAEKKESIGSRVETAPTWEPPSSNTTWKLGWGSDCAR